MEGGKTKRKLTTYNIFVKKYMAQHKGEDVRQSIKKAAGEWKKLSEAEKAKYK